MTGSPFHDPHTPLQVIADATLATFVEACEDSGRPIYRAVFFVVAENREAMTAGYNFDRPEDMFEFLLSYAKQLGKAIGVDVAVINPDQN